MRIQYKPLISWLWFGAALMMFGGICSLVSRAFIRMYKKNTQVQDARIQAASNLDFASN